MRKSMESCFAPVRAAALHRKINVLHGRREDLLLMQPKHQVLLYPRKQKTPPQLIWLRVEGCALNGHANCCAKDNVLQKFGNSADLKAAPISFRRSIDAAA